MEASNMQAVFIKKRQIWVLSCYLFLFLFLIIFGGMLKDNALPVVAEPYYHGAAEKAVVSLTINVDWGEEYLPDMLRVLDSYNVKATFFLTGRWVDNNSELAAQIAAAGHEIGNHGYSHVSPNKSSYEKNMEEITSTGESITKATGVNPKLYAPPSGESKEHVLRAAEDAGYTTILWSVDTIDWQRPSPTVIMDRVKKKIHNGAIILAHPTQPTLEALPGLLKYLQDQGYTFVTVSENLGL
jgi:probable sporulation protein (polysaccharide deacetylase family)